MSDAFRHMQSTRTIVFGPGAITGSTVSGDLLDHVAGSFTGSDVSGDELVRVEVLGSVSCALQIDTVAIGRYPLCAKELELRGAERRPTVEANYAMPRDVLAVCVR